MIAVATSSVIIGVGLVWGLVRPGVAATLDTWQLIFMIGLVVLPGVAYFAWDAERRAR